MKDGDYRRLISGSPVMGSAHETEKIVR